MKNEIKANWQGKEVVIKLKEWSRGQEIKAQEYLTQKVSFDKATGRTYIEGMKAGMYDNEMVRCCIADAPFELSMENLNKFKSHEFKKILRAVKEMLKEGETVKKLDGQSADKN